MPSRNNASAIDCFVWKDGHAFHDKLIYYDQNGEYHESDLGAGMIETALGIFKRGKKAIQRASGGLSMAEPYQMVLITDDTGQPNIHIKVKIRDFKLSENGLYAESSYVTHTKIVAPTDLKDPFPLSFWEGTEQRFLVDLGMGAVPVHVFHYQMGPGNTPMAYFVELADIENLLTSQPGTKLAIQAYAVERDVLRYAPIDPETGRCRQLEIAKENYERMKTIGQPVIPTCLELGKRMLVPAGISGHDIRHFLRRTILERLNARKEERPATTSQPNTPNASLISFGRFEE